MKFLSSKRRPLQNTFKRGLPTWVLCSLVLLALPCADVAASRLVNLSTRARVYTGSNVMIAGLILQGSGSADLVFRGIGPSLAPHFPGQYLADPYLELRNANGGLIFANNNWQDSQAGDISASGLAPSHGAEAAIRWWLSAGSYTAILQGVGGGVGIGLVEVYHLNAQSSSIYLANMSTRARTESSANETLGMFVQGNGYKGLVLRAMGPSTGVPGYLPNPSLRMYNSGGGLIQYNENWKDSQHQHIFASGFAPVHDVEAAMTTNPNLYSNTSYTATVSDNSGASGVTNLEIYDLGHEIYEDAILAGGLMVCCNPAIVRISPLLIPQSAGSITVHYAGYATADCLGQPCNPTGSSIWPELLDANGNVVQSGYGQRMGLGMNPSNRTHTFFNWSGAAFRVRMMAQSNANPSRPDSVRITYWDIYGP